MNLLKNQQAAEPIDGIYQELEMQLMLNIVRHLKGWQQPIDTDRWSMQKLAEIGKLTQENIKIIAEMAGMSQTAAERMLNDMAEEAISQIDPGLRELARRNLIGETMVASKSNNVKQAMKSLRLQAKDALNICNTTMLYKTQDQFKGFIKDIGEEVLKVLGNHASEVVTGAEARGQAIRKCIKRLNDKGITAYVDKAGREWTPEAYINMVMRNTAKNTAEEVQTARIKDAGVNLIQIDSHSGARPKCAKDQGKIFSLDNTSGYTEDLYGRKIEYLPWDSSSYGEPDGILGINCKHHKWPFVPSVNVQRYFPTEDIDANNELYKKTQVQRALEREVRGQKRLCVLYNEIGDKEAFEDASVKLKQKEIRLKNYVDTHDNLHWRKDREQIVGFDKGVSARVVETNKGYQKKLAEKARNDKIISDIKSSGIKGEINLSPNTNIDISNFTFDDLHINAERKHQVTREEAERFIREADISVTRWNGRFINYYGSDGATYIDTENNNIRTSFHKEQFDDNVKKMREVLKKYGKG